MIEHEFHLDGFQVEAAAAIDSGENVLVCAPTGSGKTVVAEHAVGLALASSKRCFYTTPIKALSNQKYNDLRRQLGDEKVGLLTGDHSIRPDAPIVVMTTEVLRNMIYSGSSSLDDLGWVVLDEVHFIQDTYRGPVWEEVLVHTPTEVRFICLSATVSNSAELGDWITTLRGPTRTVVEHRRPIRLEPVLIVGDRSSEQDHLVPLLVHGRANPEGHRFDVDRPVRRGAGGRARSRFYTPRRLETVERLDSEGLLPAIYFIFSRNACDDAARFCRNAGVRLTTSDDRALIRAIADERTESLSHTDLGVLGYDAWLDTLESGCAAHHAGMVPAFRETVEECFEKGLLKVVFATETLALGINMPARSVVIEKLSKFNGETHEVLTPGQFTQLTGRAGRRGIDVLGTAVVLWSPFSTFEQIATLAASREFPLSSAFRPTYNMAANLVRRYDRESARQVLRRSFAQFQADKALVRLEARRVRLEEELGAICAGDSNAHQVFDVVGYAAAQDELNEAQRHQRGTRSDHEDRLRALRPGDVIERSTKRGDQILVVLAVSQRRNTTKVRTTDRTARPVLLDSNQPTQSIRVLTRIDLPVPHLPRDPGFRRGAADMLGRVDVARLSRLGSEQTDSERQTAQHLRQARRSLQEHPLHDHPDRESLMAGHHARRRLQDELLRLERDMDRRGSSLAAQFDAVLSVLEGTGHTAGWALTPSGERLRRIYHECDLLLSMALDDGILEGLDVGEVAAIASCFTYEHRSAEPPPPPVMPGRLVADRVERLGVLSSRLHSVERTSAVPTTRAPDAGFAATAWAWASGHDLQLVLDEDLTGGDFVRNVRQLIDLLRQIAQVAACDTTRATARDAATALLRGVIVSAGSPE